MAVTTYFNKYYDDLNISDTNGLTPQDKNYLRILFEPARAVQSRELNQLQSLLQLQVDRLGQSLFVANSPIKAGESKLDPELRFIDIDVPLIENQEFVRTWLEEESAWVGADEYENKLTLTQPLTTTLAIILKAEEIESGNESFVRYRLFIKYKSKSVDNDGENISEFNVATGTSLSLNYLPNKFSFRVSSIIRNPEETEVTLQKLTGPAIGVTLDPGIYFTKGTAVTTVSQFATFALDDAEILFTGNAILLVDEQTVSGYDDISLNDNAAGSPNYAAPGADRYQINLTLKLVDDFIAGDPDAAAKGYLDAISILDILDSNVIREFDGNDNLKVINRILALRTYEESGDYVVEPFKVHLSEVWNNGEGNNGRYNNVLDLKDSMSPYLEKQGIDIDQYEDEDYIEESSNWFVAQLDPSTAYVKGVRAHLKDPNVLLGRKTRDTWLDKEETYKDISLSANLGNYVIATYEEGIPNIDSPNARYLLWGPPEPLVSDVIAGKRASTILDPDGDNNNVFIQAKEVGFAGNNINISLEPSLVDGYASGVIYNSSSLEVQALEPGPAGNFLSVTVEGAPQFATANLKPDGINNNINITAIVSGPNFNTWTTNNAIQPPPNGYDPRALTFATKFDAVFASRYFPREEGDDYGFRLTAKEPGPIDSTTNGELEWGDIGAMSFELTASTTQADEFVDDSGDVTPGDPGGHVYRISYKLTETSPGSGMYTGPPVIELVNFINNSTDPVYPFTAEDIRLWVPGNQAIVLPRLLVPDNPGPSTQVISPLRLEYSGISKRDLGSIVEYTHDSDTTAQQLLDFVNNDPDTKFLIEPDGSENNLSGPITWIDPTLNPNPAFEDYPSYSVPLVYKQITHAINITQSQPIPPDYREILFTIDNTPDIEPSSSIWMLADYIRNNSNPDTLPIRLKNANAYNIRPAIFPLPALDQIDWPNIPLSGGENYEQIYTIKNGDSYIFKFDAVGGTRTRDLADYINSDLSLPFTASRTGNDTEDIAQLSRTFLSGGVDANSGVLTYPNTPWESGDPHIGTCKIQSIESEGDKKLRLYLHDIKLNPGETFSNVHYVGSLVNITGDDPEEKHYGALKATLVNPGEILDTGDANSLFRLPYDAVNHVQNINVNEKRSYVNPYIWQDDTVNFNISSGPNSFDTSPSNIEVLFHPGGLTGQYIVVSDYGLDVTDAQDITFNFTNSLESGQLKEKIEEIINGPFDHSTSNIAKANSYVRIMITVYVELGIGNDIRGKKTLTTQDITIPGPIEENEIVELPNIYHLDSVNRVGDDSIPWSIVHDGQTPTEYVPAKLKSLTAHSGDVTVNVTHWLFSDGDYYTANSYYHPNNDRVKLEEIPNYKRVQLNEYLDFRQRSNSENRIALDPYSPIQCKIDFYLPRADSIIVQTNEIFSILEGEPGDDPKYPDIPKDGMALFNIDLDPYVYTIPANIELTRIDNRRYTMRDIGDLDNRISKLEYYTTLSLLEKSAGDESIYDKSGERFKNGFVVDGFRGHDVGDSSNPDYKCSVWREKGRLFPHHDGYSVPLKLSNAQQIQGTAQYPKTGINTNTITLPYRTVQYIKQPFATQYISVQPHEVVSVPGLLRLNPAVDTWVDTENRPSVSIDPLKDVNNAIRQVAELTGILGTEWGEWGITDVSSEVVGRFTQRRTTTSSSRRRRITGRAARGWPLRATETRTTTRTTFIDTLINTDTTTTFERPGVQTGVFEGEEIGTSLGRYVTDVGIKPFMRTRVILFSATGLLPNTRYYPHFDGTRVDNYVWPTAEPRSSQSPNGRSGTAEWWSELLSLSNEGMFDGLDESTLLDMFNAWYVDSAAPAAGHIIKSDNNGSLYAAFVLPNSPTLRFAGGEKTLKLTDSPRNNTDEEESTAAAKYIASGLKQTTGETILTTRPIAVEERDVTGTRQEVVRTTDVINRQIVDRRRSTSSRSFWFDPVAQSFKIDEPTGIFLTDIDIYFAAKPSPDTNPPPVNVYLVSMSSGLPSTEIIPSSKVVKQSSDVNISINATVPTNFEFEDPIYLQADEEYTVVVFSPSTRYKVFISEIGGTAKDLTTGQLVKHQPATGVFFTSSNKSTWLPEPNKDLKLTLNRAEFDLALGSTGATVYSKPVVSNSVSHITITNPGDNYNLGATITIDPPASTEVDIGNFTFEEEPARASAAILEVDPGSGKIERIEVLKKGFGYAYPPICTIDGPSGTGATAVAHLMNVDISSFVLNQETVIVDQTRVNNQLDLGPAENLETYNCKSGVPFTELRSLNHYINSNVAAATRLKSRLFTNDARVSPVIDISSMSLQTRKYNITDDPETTSKYFTKKINLKDPAGQIDGYLAINRPSAASDVKAYIQLFDINGQVITRLDGIDGDTGLMSITTVQNTPTVNNELVEGDIIPFTVTIENTAGYTITGVKLIFDRTIDNVVDTEAVIGGGVSIADGNSVTVTYNYTVTATDVNAGNILNNTWTRMETDVSNSFLENQNDNLTTLLKKGTIQSWWSLPAIEPKKIPISTEKYNYKDVRFQRNFEEDGVEFSSFVIKLALLCDNIVEVPSLNSLRFIASS